MAASREPLVTRRPTVTPTNTVQVLHKGGEERVFTLETGEAYLGAVLTAEDRKSTRLNSSH